MKRRKLTRVLFVGVCVVIGVIGYVAWSIYAYSDNSETVQADAVIVLGAEVWGERPSPVFRERINHAVQLYHDGYVSKIVFTGGQGDGGELAEAVVARRYAVELAIPETDILIEDQSRTTEQNLYYAHQIASDQHLTSFLIVSDPLHMKRAMLLARDMGMDVYSSPTPTTMYQSSRTQLRFLARETYFYLTYLLRRPFVLRQRSGNVQKTQVICS